MLLAVDVGNTNIKFGIFDGEFLVNTLCIPSDRNINEYEQFLMGHIKEYNLDSCIIASVKEGVDIMLKKVIDSLFQINALILSLDLDFGFKLKTNGMVGADRIANSAAAKNLYGSPAIVVDSGSATTFDIIDKNGDFIGGIIMPGINLQFQALANNTSKLPKVEPDYCSAVIGSNTKDAMLSGVIDGHLEAIKGLILKCKSEMDGIPQIILTGGFANLIYTNIPEYFNACDSDLTLKGLKIIYDRNLIYIKY